LEHKEVARSEFQKRQMGYFNRSRSAAKTFIKESDANNFTNFQGYDQTTPTGETGHGQTNR
jgi:hypothetical protein